MGRPLRLQYAGAFYHIMNRGLERRNIFLTTDHKKIFLDLLSDISEKYDIEVHSYCLMNNHYHLLVKINLLNLDAAIKHLNGVYTIRFNRDVKRDGPLFRGRYKSILVDKNDYFLNVSRYIHKNPSTAKIIKEDKYYDWSSYQYYWNVKRKPEWLCCEEVLSYFNNSHKKYVNFVEEGVDDDTKTFYSSKQLKSVFGDRSFIKKVFNKSKNHILKKDFVGRGLFLKKNYPSKDEIISILEKKYDLNIDRIFSVNSKNFNYERNLFIYLIMQNPRYNLRERGEFLRVSGDAISKSYKRFFDRISLNKKLNVQVEKIREDIYG